MNLSFVFLLHFCFLSPSNILYTKLSSSFLSLNMLSRHSWKAYSVWKQQIIYHGIRVRIRLSPELYTLLQRGNMCMLARPPTNDRH